MVGNYAVVAGSGTFARMTCRILCSRRWLALASFALVVPMLAQADVLVATQTSDGLQVSRITAKAIAPVLIRKAQNLTSYAWSNRRTLWVARGTAAELTVEKIVDGKLMTSIALTALTALPSAVAGKGVPSGTDLTPRLALGKRGQVYVTSCLGVRPFGGAMSCQLGYTRIDDGSKRFSKAAPAGLIWHWGEAQPRAAAPVKAPAGYLVKLAQVVVRGRIYSGFTCTGPKGQKLSWPLPLESLAEPRLVPKAKRIIWLAAAPPIVQVVATGISPTGQRMSEDVYILDCSTTVSQVQSLGAGLWLLDGTVRSSTAVIGMLLGSAPVVSP